MAIGRPNSDLVNLDGWTNETGATSPLFSSINEATLNLSNWISVISYAVSPAPTRAVTFTLSTPTALGAGESYLMSCYAAAAYSSGGARIVTWELLEGLTVLETVGMSVTSAGPAQFTRVVTASIGDITNLRYRFTHPDDGTIFSVTVYQAELRAVYPHLDLSTPEPRLVAANSGSFLSLGATSPVPVLQAGSEDGTGLVIDSVVPRVHG